MLYLPIYDLFLDIPHPMASPGNSPAKIIGPPARASPARATPPDPVTEELYEGENVARITRYAFPDHDENRPDLSSFQSARHLLNNVTDENDECHDGGVGSPLSATEATSVSRSPLSLNIGGAAGSGAAAELNAHDVSALSCPRSSYYTFALRLSRTGARVHGHVRRYLPPHRDSPSRIDVGRRCVRAMVILTRSSGGERFWSSLLETIEATCVLRDSARTFPMCDVEQPHSFLHEVYEKHAQLWHEFYDGNLGDDGHDRRQQRASLAHASACGVDARNKRQLEFVLEMEGVEFGTTNASTEGASLQKRRPLFDKDCIKFHLPPSLQPSFGEYPAQACPSPSKMEDIDSPMLPLLRCLQSSHFLRLLSALLCERRVILISADLALLSACVRGAGAALAQGLLVWQHILVPVLPPHLLKYLANPAPYLIGLPEMHTRNLEMIPGVCDVLCVDLDTNIIWTYHVPDPESSFPDLLRKVERTEAKADGGGGGAGSSCSPSAAISLAQSLTKVLKADKKMWSRKRRVSTIEEGLLTKLPPSLAASGARTSASSLMTFDSSICSEKSGSNGTWSLSGGGDDGVGRRESKIAEGQTRSKRFGRTMYDRLAEWRGDSLGSMSTRSGETSVEGAGEEKIDHCRRQQQGQRHQPVMHHEDDSTIHTAPSASEVLLNDSLEEHGTAITDEEYEHPRCGENERGEESIRIALVSFFLASFGDMGMYLSESRHDCGELVLDRNKFLLLKRLEGHTEHTPMFRVLATLTRTDMFRQFVRMRIDELESDDDGSSSSAGGNDPSSRLHLFSRCEHHLLLKGMNATNPNIPQVVKMIAESCSSHRCLVLAGARARKRAISLTTRKRYFDDELLRELVTLSEDCKDVGGILPHVMSVIWTRLQEQIAAATGAGGGCVDGLGTSTTHWRCSILALHLLRSVLLHGPITSVVQAFDNIDLIHHLIVVHPASSSATTLLGGTMDGIREIRQLALCVYDLLLDRAVLFCQRRHCAGKKLKSTALHRCEKDGPRWQNYLIAKVPSGKISFQRIHSLMRPTIEVVVLTKKASANNLQSRDNEDTYRCSDKDNDAESAEVDTRKNDCFDAILPSESFSRGGEYDLDSSRQSGLEKMIDSFNSAMDVTKATNESLSVHRLPLDDHLRKGKSLRDEGSVCTAGTDEAIAGTFCKGKDRLPSPRCTEPSRLCRSHSSKNIPPQQAFQLFSRQQLQPQ